MPFIKLKAPHKAAPNEIPASEHAGKTNMFLKFELSKSFLFATEFNATPPAKHIFCDFIFFEYPYLNVLVLFQKHLEHHMLHLKNMNLNDFKCSKISKKFPIVLMASRLIKDKGVVEFIEAAEYLKKKKI